MAKTYSEKLLDPRWQKKRLEIFQRDNFICRRCNNHKETLHVHHLVYRRGANPWDYENEVLLTVCDPCHDLYGKEDDLIKDWMANLENRKKILSFVKNEDSSEVEDHSLASEMMDVRVIYDSPMMIWEMFMCQNFNLASIMADCIRYQHSGGTSQIMPLDEVMDKIETIQYWLDLVKKGFPKKFAEITGK